MSSLRHRLGALVYDWPRYIRHIGGDSTLLRNRAERIESDGRGVRCDWQYTSALHIANVYPSTGGALMRRALAKWPIAMRESPESTSAPPDVSFVIGHRGTARLPNLLATLRSIAGQEGVAIECVVVEQSPAREIEHSLPSWVRYLHQPVAADLDYCRSATFNEAVRHVRGEVLIAHDNDMLVPRDYAAHVVARAREGFDFIDLKRFIFYLSENDTHQIFSGAPLAHFVPSTVIQNLKGGSIAATRRSYLEIGGFDEEFVGWGGEDLEFWERARAHGRVYEYGYLPIVHLWHASQKGKTEGAAAPAIRRYYEVTAAIPIDERIARLRAANFSNEK